MEYQIIKLIYLEWVSVEYFWTGEEKSYLNEPKVTKVSDVVIGRYGGNVNAGANKNEDGAIVIDDFQGWKLAMILDSHNSSESVKLIQDTVRVNLTQLYGILNSEHAFTQLEPFILSLFSDEDFINECKKIRGEDSCLICFQRGQYLWWFSIGDCMIYLFHPELKQLGQYGLNQRQFYEWIGQVNTFDMSVPCFSSGRRQLRKGMNYIVLMTDGIIDTDDGYYSEPSRIYKSVCNNQSVEGNVRTMLDRIHHCMARDSGTIIAWVYDNTITGLMPSDQ